MMYALLFPALIYFAVFKYIPMAGIIIAFKNYNLALGLWDSPWVGFRNFTDFMNGVYFWDIMRNTIIISLYKLLFGFSAPIILALLLNEVYTQWFKKNRPNDHVFTPFSVMGHCVWNDGGFISPGGWSV
ncbi:hypothetical protein ACFTAO_22775 [Paenibacillus rhizoplanae]